ncbi:MAG: TonB-dependent receptor, partial [Saprospiraceae bacterium]
DAFLEVLAHELNEITVSAARTFQPSVSRITKDDLNTVAGNYDDPIRVAHIQPGVVQINDQANHLSFRGQSPAMNTWFLEGLEIVNPSHTNNAGTFSDLPAHSGGGVNLFSAHALSHTEIYKGLHSLSIGRSAGLVTNMHLHESAKPEFRAKAGFLGFEFGGGAAIGQKSILDINLRYSFTGLLANMGVDFGGEKIGFYDGVISFRHEGLKHKLKIFAWSGQSENEFNHVEDAAEIEEYKDLFDIDYKNSANGGGVRYDVALGLKLHLRSGVAYSKLESTHDRAGGFPPQTNTHIETTSNLFSSFAEFAFIHSPRVNTSVGLNYVDKRLIHNISPYRSESFIRPYIQVDLKPTEALSIDLGADVNRSFETETLTPGYRAMVRLKIGENRQLYAGARHSAGPYLYPSDDISDKDPMIVDNYEAGWNMQNRKHALSAGLFYNLLSNLPVVIVTEGYVHLADYLDGIWEYSPTDVEEGSGRYYGIEVEWNYRNDKGWKFLINQTFYDSQRRIGSGSYLGGRFDGNYATHMAISKEIIREKKGKNRIWNFSLRGTINGGIWEQSIDEQASAQIQDTDFLQPGVYGLQLPAYKRIDAGISRTIANPKVRWRYALDIQNVAGFSNIAHHYYDPFLQDISTKDQLGIIPVLSVQASW